MVYMKIVAKVQSGKRGEFLDAMRSLKKDRIREPGILDSQVYASSEDPTRFIIIDKWETDEDLLRYFKKESYRILLGALRTLCLEAEITHDPLPKEWSDLNFYNLINS